MNNKEVITLTKKEYGELLSSEFDNGYSKGYREALEQEKNEWDKVKEQILEEKEHAYADFDDYKMAYLNAESDELPYDDFRFGMERTIDIINKYLKEIEE